MTVSVHVIEAALPPRTTATAFEAPTDGVADATQALIDAVAYANGFIRNGLTANIKHPGATLIFSAGKYNLSTLAAPLEIKCNVVNEGAEIIVPASYDDEVFRVGLDSTGDLLACARIDLPGVSKVSGSAIVAGSVGYRICNVNDSEIRLPKAMYFERGARLGGEGQGCVYNDIWLGQFFYNQVGISLKPGTGGWCNTNNIYSGNLAVYPSFSGGDFTTGYVHIEMDGRGGSAVVGNNFYGTSLEGSSVGRIIDANLAYGNNLFGCYHETGIAAASVSLSGDTFTDTAHGLAVDDLLTFDASVSPTDMQLGAGYYVTSVPTADTFKVSRNKGGSAITFGSSGTTVTYYRQGHALFSQTGSEYCAENRLVNWFMPPSQSMDVRQTGTALCNGFDLPFREIREQFEPENRPLFRARNKSTSSLGALWAAYGASIDPATQPELWSAALAADGVVWAAGGSETGRLSNSSGVLSYEALASGTTKQVASCLRSSSFTTLGSTVVPANGRAIVTLTLTGVAAGQFVTPAISSALADGIAIAWSRVSAADTVQVCFHNWTGADIDINGTQIKALVHDGTY